MTKYDIAASMNGIMTSPSYQAVFTKPSFNKTAAKKEEKDTKGDKDEDKKSKGKSEKTEEKGKDKVEKKDDKGKKAEKPEAKKGDKDKSDVKDGKKEEKKEEKGKKDKKDAKGKCCKKASQYQACVMGLAKISELLDDVGLEKAATHTLLALDSLVKSAQYTVSGDEVVFEPETITGKEPGVVSFTPDTITAQAPKLHPLDPGLETPDEFLSSIDPNDPLNPYLGQAPDAATVNQIIAQRNAYRAANPSVNAADDGENDCDMGDCGDTDANDVYSVPASKLEGEGGEEAIEHLGGEPIEFPLGEQWLAELDEEELDPKNSPMARMMKLLKEKKENEEPEAVEEAVIDGDDDGEDALMEEEEVPEYFEFRSMAGKKLTSLQKLALEIQETRSFLGVKAAGKKDPKAEVRNKPDAIFGDKHPKVKDSKDHFPIDTIGRARNALARVQQFDSAPPWWKGSLEELKNAVSRAVKKKYPSINVGGKDKKKD